MKSPQIVLASASPRRRELLDQIGVTYRVSPVSLDETPLPAEAPEAYVVRVASEKSDLAWDQSDKRIPVLSADTAVVLDGIIMGKPANEADAEGMLKRLSGTTHQVYSAVSLRTPECSWQALNVTDVTFRDLTLSEIRSYWRTGEPCDKAGAYAIQGIGGLFVRKISGSFSGVMGLPLFETAQLLSKAGITII
ncbi:MAG: Maf family protein [Gammaproteobacteria bacterium]